MATIKVKNAEGVWEDVAVATQMEVEPIVLTGSQPYGCSGVLSSTYIKLFGNTITTKNLYNTDHMFADSPIEEIPFSLNYGIGSDSSKSQIFYNCYKLKKLPDIYGGICGNMYQFLYNCNNVRELPESWYNGGIDWNKINTATSWLYCRLEYFFYGCYSLRVIPEDLLKRMYVSCSGAWGNNMFNYCRCLDELVGLRGPNTTLTSNTFSNTFGNCCRLKRLVFDTDNGTPYIQQWKSQTIDLNNLVGHFQVGTARFATSYNSGITADKEVTNDATYQALKNDPDWFTCNPAYCRYNHDSAVETINSLPDTSAYLATAGGTNTIKFNSNSGSATDGGAINTLTEEEIAVATAKGWTVTLS